MMNEAEIEQQVLADAVEAHESGRHRNRSTEERAAAQCPSCREDAAYLDSLTEVK
jgi:hypothetical protein